MLVGAETDLANCMAVTRRREFSAGRNAARMALRHLQFEECAIPIGPHGEPGWPPGAAVSISHSPTHVCAIVALSRCHQSLGVDLDDVRPLGDAAAADLMTPEEIDLVTQEGWARDRTAAQNLVFSAKEAIFKCQFPLTGHADLDFPDVHLAIGAQTGSLGVTTTRLEPELISALGRIKVFRDRIEELSMTWASSGPPSGRNV